VDTTQKLPTVLSLCTGYGGIERGLDLAGVEHRVIAHVEIEAFAIANLVAKMEAGKLDAAPVWSNLKTLPVESFRDRVDILTGGYPCQPFSAAGKRLGEEDPRHLWPYICDIIRAVRPVRCFFENVEGHISLGLREVISDLESLGYKVAWGIFSAREVGAPHQRKRVYIMADCDNGLSQFSHKEIRTGGDASINGGSDTMADSQSELSKRTISERDRTRQSEEALGDRSDSEGASSVAHTESYGGGRELRQLPKANESVRESQEYRKNEASKSYDAGQNGASSVADTDSSWELQSKRNERNEWGRVSDCSEELADTDSSGLGQGNKEDERQSSEQLDSSGFRSGIFSNSNSLRSRALSDERQFSDISISVSESEERRASSNPNNEGLEGRLQGGCTDTQGRQEQEIRCAAQRSDWGSGDGHSLWPPEPRLGRVVDGCANRVDRIRLLGNGVVPQTAAKAWMVLSEEL
jgi:DNA-cytosine methyltransferase